MCADRVCASNGIRLLKSSDGVSFDFNEIITSRMDCDDNGGGWFRAADIDGDGDLDVVAASTADTPIVFYNVEGELVPSLRETGLPQADNIALADMDNVSRVVARK